MRLRRMFIITIVSIFLALPSILPNIAAGEQGTGTLYVYMDYKMTILVMTDSDGRYYAVPGTDYYFNITGISEYSVGQEITIWAYRVNTGEDVFIDNVIVDSTPKVIFSWMIPETWLDEVVKIKYGTSLESSWVYAQKELWINARVGTGVLKVYTDALRTLEAPLGTGDEYLVYPGTEYYFTIDGITEYQINYVSVWAFYKIGWTTYNTEIDPGVYKVQPKVEFSWTIPSNIPIETWIKFKYGTRYKGPRPNWYFAKRETASAPRLLLVIPGVFLGSIGAITALFSGLGLKAFRARRR